jgi:hypothetical protein
VRRWNASRPLPDELEQRIGEVESQASACGTLQQRSSKHASRHGGRSRCRPACARADSTSWCRPWPRECACAALSGWRHDAADTGWPTCPTLIAWQRQHGRHGLPWQGTRDPYRVWLSEVMLQQTQVSDGAGLLPALPGPLSLTSRPLAAAPLDEVLALWSGLGYYSRARNLHRCAQVVVAEHGGRFPVTAARCWPRCRASAAAPRRRSPPSASASAAAILDGNVKRVLTRVLGFGATWRRPGTRRHAVALAEALLPEAGDRRRHRGLHPGPDGPGRHGVPGAQAGAATPARWRRNAWPGPRAARRTIR